MKFCTQCLYGDSHPLGITFDQDGLCSGCQIHQEKDNIDWSERWEALKQLANPYRSINSKNYDCIVPVTGGQDSFFTVYLVKEKLKLNPLLVCFNKYFNTHIGIRNLANLRIQFNCDLIIQNINPKIFKKVLKETLRSFGSVYWPILAGRTTFPVQTAIRFQIPLIIWGAHQGLEQVGMFSHLDNVEMTRRYRKDHDLMGYEADDLITHFNSLKEEDIWQFRYPDDLDIARVGIKGIYLGNFVRWDPKAQHELMIKKFKYETCKFNRTFDCYDYTDCYNYMNVHDLLKLYRHGYSKVTDHASREIRFGRITRDEGMALVKKHEMQAPESESLFLEWTDIKEKSFKFLADCHKSKKFWNADKYGRWSFNGWSKIQHKPEKKYNKLKIKFRINQMDFKKNKNTKNQYTLIGKGFAKDIKNLNSNWYKI